MNDRTIFPRILKRVRSFRHLENTSRRCRSILGKRYFKSWFRYTFFNFTNLNTPKNFGGNSRKIKVKQDIIKQDHFPSPVSSA